MASHYKLLFRGAIHADQHAAVVRPRLQALLKASDAQMDVMFSGKPVTIKKSVDEATAERYLDAFFKAGAKLELVEAAAPAAQAVKQPEVAAKPAATDSKANSTAESAQTEADNAAFQLADVGADLVAADERPAPVESPVATDHLTLANPGARLGTEAQAVEAQASAVDTSHLQLDQPGVRLGVPAPEADDIQQLLNFDFELGEVGEVLVESTPPVEPQLPDLSHLQLESLPAADSADAAEELS